MYLQHEHISRVSFVSLCVCLHACTQQFADHMHRLTCMFRRRLDQTAFGLICVAKRVQRACSILTRLQSWCRLGKRRRRCGGCLRESKPTQDARDKAARKHRQIGEEMEALQLFLEAKSQAWMVVASALEAAQEEVDAWATRLRREQEQVSATAMQGTQNGTPQQWAAGFAAAVPPAIVKPFQSWLWSVSPDTMRHHLLECADDCLDRDLHNLDADVLSNSDAWAVSTSVASAMSRALFSPRSVPLQEGLAGTPTNRHSFAWEVQKRGWRPGGLAKDASPSGGLSDFASDEVGRFVPRWVSVT